MSQDMCPRNMKFTRELLEPAFAARGAIAGKDARTFAHELLAKTQGEFPVAFSSQNHRASHLRSKSTFPQCHHRLGRCSFTRGSGSP